MTEIYGYDSPEEFDAAVAEWDALHANDPNPMLANEGVRVDENGQWADWSIPEVLCAELRKLDTRFGTDSRSPLHHDQRCPIHTRHP